MAKKKSNANKTIRNMQIGATSMSTRQVYRMLRAFKFDRYSALKGAVFKGKKRL